MADQIRQIAQRVRELREIAQLSSTELAAQLGVAQDELLAYESGERDIPVSYLLQVGQRFGVELVALLTGGDARLQSYCLVRRGQGVKVQRRQQYGYEALAYNFVHPRAEPFLVTVPPEEPGAEVQFNAHPGQEFNYVLTGRVRITIADHELVLEEGDSLYFDSSLPHAMVALDGRPARFLAVVV